MAGLSGCPVERWPLDFFELKLDERGAMLRRQRDPQPRDQPQPVFRLERFGQLKCVLQGRYRRRFATYLVAGREPFVRRHCCVNVRRHADILAERRISAE